MQATWMPYTEHCDLSTRSNLPDSVFAFPLQRKEPLTDASHVRNALARFDQVEGISDQGGRRLLRRRIAREELARSRPLVVAT